MYRTHSKNKRLTSRRGFTLLEVIVVVTIIALLATLVAPRLLGNIGKAKQKGAQAGVNTIAQQVNIWMADNGYSRLPDDFELEQLTAGDDPALRKKDLTDPWDNPFVLVNPGDVNPDFDIVSFGADGQPGGEGEDKDITN